MDIEITALLDIRYENKIYPPVLRAVHISCIRCDGERRSKSLSFDPGIGDAESDKTIRQEAGTLFCQCTEFFRSPLVIGVRFNDDFVIGIVSQQLAERSELRVRRRCEIA